MQIPFFRIFWDEEDIQAVNNIIKRGLFWAGGPGIDLFEEEIAEYVGREYCVVFNSGTSALHAAFMAHGISKGDEAIVPSFTFIATANAALFTAATSVFADIEEKTFGLDPESVGSKITNRTKAIVPVHVAGCPCLIRELKEIAVKHDLILIEDAAESLGAKVNGRKVGTFGDSAIFSFCQNKIITTGEGGAVVTDSRDIYEKLKLVRSHGRQEDPSYIGTPEYLDCITLGYNFRMPEMLAALGTSQIKKVDKLIEMRRKNAQYLTRKLTRIGEIAIPESPDDYFHVYQMYMIFVKDGGRVRQRLVNYMSEKGITTRVPFNIVHLTRFYREQFAYHGGELPTTEKIADQALALPIFPSQTEREIDYVSEMVNNFFKT